MDLETKLEEAQARRKQLIEQVNALAEEIERLRQERQALLQEALRYDGEVRALQALINESRESKNGE